MKKPRLLYLIICILLILFFCTACIFTQCSKEIAGLVFKAISTENNDAAGSSSSQPDDDTFASISEETYGLVRNRTEVRTPSSGWDDYNSSGISGVPINFKIEYEFLIPGDTDSITFTTCIPADYKYRQKIKNYGFSVRPDRIFTDDGNRYAVFKLIHPVNKFFISMDIQMELFDFDLLAAQKTPGNLVSGSLDKDGQLLAEYLISEAHLEADDPQIEAAAGNFDSAGQLELVKQDIQFCFGPHAILRVQSFGCRRSRSS